MADAMDDPLRRTIAENVTLPELVRLADLLADYKVRLQAVEDEASKVRLDMEATEAQLFDALENAGIRQVRTDRGLFTQNDLAWASIEDRAKAIAWAEQVQPDLLSLNSQRLSKLVRDHLKGEGELEAMPDGVSFKTSRKITWRRQ